MDNLHDKIARLLLPAVTTPGQYIGTELNAIRKDPSECDLRVALAFPDTYAVGMSYIGYAILYAILNGKDDIGCERVFAPWTDAAEVMRKHDIPLYSWETRTAVRDFDVVGITLQHELSYSNVLYLLDLAGITFRAVDRGEDEPLIVGGGPLADCCEPVADFFDLVVLGDGEEAFPAVLEAIRELAGRKSGVRRGSGGGVGPSRRELLLEIGRRFPFVYVPQFYECNYHADGTLASLAPTEDGLPTCVERAIVADLDQAGYPTAPVVPFTESIHDRIAIEIMRGCPQRCAFCHAGHTRGPLRARSVDTIVDIAWQSYLKTGHDTVSLLSLSSSDYPDLGELVERLYGRFEGEHVGISLPSLRVDKQLKDLPGTVAGVRREGLTLAVETASDRIRKAIGKRVTDGDLLATVWAAYEAGWRRAKLYFMVGLPGERDDDIDAIVDLSGQISHLRREVAGGPAAVSATVSWLVPKPHTPLQFMAMQGADYFYEAKRALLWANKSLRGASVHLKFHHMQRSLLEGAFARGDRRLGRVIEAAYKAGAKFDAWDECFDYQLYVDAFAECGLAAGFYAHRERGEHEVLPWDHLGGTGRATLYRRYERIKAMVDTGQAS